MTLQHLDTALAFAALRRHVLGTLMTVLFLSLGAPFWFNILRQLANLRPVIARKVEEEEKGEGQA